MKKRPDIILLQQRTAELSEADFSNDEIRQKLEHEGFRRVEVFKAVQDLKDKQKTNQRSNIELVAWGVFIILATSYAIWLIASGTDRAQGLALLASFSFMVVATVVAGFFAIKWLRRQRLGRESEA